MWFPCTGSHYLKLCGRFACVVVEDSSSGSKHALSANNREVAILKVRVRSDGRQRAAPVQPRLF